MASFCTRATTSAGNSRRTSPSQRATLGRVRPLTAPCLSPGSWSVVPITTPSTTSTPAVMRALACRLLPFRVNRLANIVAGVFLTLVNGFLTFGPPLLGWGMPPAFAEYLFFATIETVCTLIIVWQAWQWVEGGVSERAVGQA